MRRLIITCLTVILMASPACAGEWFTWDDTNTKLHVPLMLLMLADYRQTRYNSKEYYHDGGYTIKDNRTVKHRESNYILGETPKPHKVDQYFGYATLVLTGIVLVLPPNWSHGFQIGTIFIEYRVISNNYMMGAKIEF